MAQQIVKIDDIVNGENIELKTNKTLSVNVSSTDEEYPSAKGVYLADNLKVDKVANKSLVLDTEIAKIHATGSDNQVSSDFDIKDLTDSTSLRSSWTGKQDALGFTPENSANKNANNGYAPLDAGGKVPTANLPNTLMKYKSVWNASTNTPTLTDTQPTKAGEVYIVSAAGTQFSINWKLGDWLVYNDAGTIEISQNSDEVVSVAGQTGIVTLAKGDVSLGNVDNTADINKTVAKSNNIVGGNSTTLKGSIPYQIDTDTTLLLSPNVTTTKKFLRETGDGTNGAAPAWDTLAISDLPSGLVLTDQTVGQTIGATGTRLTKLWATDGEYSNMPTVGGVSLATTFLPKADIITTTTLYVDCNRTDAYTANGATQYPYKTISAAVTAGNVLAVPFTIILSPSSYTDATVATIAYPCVIKGNGSTYTIGSGAGTMTLSNAFNIYDLNIVGNLVQSNTSQAVFTTLNTVNIYGNLTVSGNFSTMTAHVFGNGVANSLITINSTAFAVFTNSVLGTNTMGANYYARIANSGYALFLNMQVFSNDNSNYALTSTTAGTSLTTSGVILTQAGTGGGINLTGSGSTNANEIVNTEVFINGTTNGITCGAAATYLDTFKIFNTNTGLPVLPTGTNILGSYDGPLNIVGNITVPSIIGGSAVGSNITYKSTTGTGTTTGIAHQWLGGTDGGTVIATMLNNGNVGLGTTAPGAKLEINSTTASEEMLRLSDATANATAYKYINWYSNNVGSQITSFARIGAGYGSAYQNSFMTFSTADSSKVLQERIRITSGDNVGIGTTTPTALLHLKAGTATAGTAPLKFTSGTLLTAPEAGTVEFLTDAFYGTITTGAIRRMFVMSQTGRATAQTAANASVHTFTLPASDGSYQICANVLVTTSSAEAFTVTVAYTDEGNTARTATLTFQLVNGTIGTNIAFANGAVPYMGHPLNIRCKASTSITVATTGIFTGCTYNVETIFKKVA